MFEPSDLRQIDETLFEIPPGTRPGGDHEMRVPARVFTRKELLEDITDDRSLDQLANVACMPGIVGWALAMPDAHEGYGFPVGGVAAFDTEDGVISPGGIGYDINCGVRLLRADVPLNEVKEKLEDVGRTMFEYVPTGVGRSGPLTLSNDEMDAVLRLGAGQMIDMGHGREDDLQNIESGGCFEDADPSLVSGNAKSRGMDQVGTIGGGNHFVEAGYIDRIFDEEAAADIGIAEGDVTVLIHTGSRGLGHQVATDWIKTMNGVMSDYDIDLPDRELACAPFSSTEGREYFGAMKAAANYAWANRQMVTEEVREAFGRVFARGDDEQAPDLQVVYDVAHNIAKVESYEVDGRDREVVVHRKGATRAFPGQPVLIPGSMGTASYVLQGDDGSMTKSFGSSCHGAGRRMSRTQARKETSAAIVRDELKEQGIVINASSNKGISEEAPLAYKDVDDVVNVVHEAGIARKVARLRPLAVIKG